jgi:hypothetical protein
MGREEHGDPQPIKGGRKEGRNYHKLYNIYCTTQGNADWV